MEARAIAKELANVEIIYGREVMVEANTELVCVLPHRLRGSKGIDSVVRFGKEAQEVLGELREFDFGQLIEGIGLACKEIHELVNMIALVVYILACTNVVKLFAHRRKVAAALGQRGNGG